MRETLTREGIAAVRAACSPRQWRIVLLWLLNFSRAEIAQQIGVAPVTVRNQISRLKGKRLPPEARDVLRSL